jgi:hypothetical protein
MAIDRGKLAALTALGIARREKLAAEDFTVYLGELVEIRPQTVADVCAQLGREEPAAFEPRFPPLYLILQRCRAHENKLARMKALPPAPPIPDPISPSKWAEIQAKFRALVRGHSMPAARRRNRA